MKICQHVFRPGVLLLNRVTEEGRISAQTTCKVEMNPVNLNVHVHFKDRQEENSAAAQT